MPLIVENTGSLGACRNFMRMLRYQRTVNRLVPTFLRSEVPLAGFSTSSSPGKGRWSRWRRSPGNSVFKHVTEVSDSARYACVYVYMRMHTVYMYLYVYIYMYMYTYMYVYV